MADINNIYQEFLEKYDKQGWWPLLNVKGQNPTKTGSVQGYHPGDYSFPKNDNERFEICVGAILTQNTAWPNVENALLNLQKLKAIGPKKILALDEDNLKQAIKPAGYFNQKARKLREFAQFYLDLSGKTPTRDQLLEVWGIGPETADSILLYACKELHFVVDAYTKRVFFDLGILDDKMSYDEIKSLFEKNLPKDIEVYQEFHALIVEHGKNMKNNEKKKEN